VLDPGELRFDERQPTRGYDRLLHSSFVCGPTRLRSLACSCSRLVCAEYLAAYDEATGDLVRLLLGLLILAPVYGAPALLIREIARRRNLGYVAMA
jgi:hypothetical protein